MSSFLIIKLTSVKFAINYIVNIWKNGNKFWLMIYGCILWVLKDYFIDTYAYIYLFWFYLASVIIEYYYINANITNCKNISIY